MLNRDKRSMVLSLVLGDGCLHYIKNNGKIYGGLTIDHGITQADYQSWKAKLLSDIFKKNVKMRNGHKGKSVQISLCMKRFKSWRKFTYPNNKKSIPKILKFINNPLFALAIWLMDDGYVETSGKYNIQSIYPTRFRIFSCDQTIEELNQITIWFKENFNIDIKIKYQKNTKKNKSYPYIKIGNKDSIMIWEQIRLFVLQFKSMKYKFRNIEQFYQLKFSQRQPSS